MPVIILSVPIKHFTRNIANGCTPDVKKALIKWPVDDGTEIGQ
jgi:hypothetical protein